MFSIPIRNYERNLSLVEMLPQLTRAGKEHHGPCWQCGGEDRFIVFPNGYSW
jgi:hypothetical protein